MVNPGPVKRIGHVAIGVPDIERSVEFYVRCMNFVLVERGRDGTAYLRCQTDHHALELHPASETRLDHMGFETLDDADVEAFRQRLEAKGVRTEAAPEEPGRLGSAFRFRDPEGNCVEVYRSIDRLASLVSPGPFTLNRLGHVGLFTRDLERAEAFYRQVVGLRLSDRRPGHGAWLRCNPDHHSLALFQSDRVAFDHHAYEIPDWNEIKRVADWCFRSRVPLAAGPMRHGPGNNVNVYVKDPDGVDVEFYAEMEQILDNDDHLREHPRSGALYGNLWQFKPSEEAIQR